MIFSSTQKQRDFWSDSKNSRYIKPFGETAQIVKNALASGNSIELTTKEQETYGKFLFEKSNEGEYRLVFPNFIRVRFIR